MVDMDACDILLAPLGNSITAQPILEKEIFTYISRDEKKHTLMPNPATANKPTAPSINQPYIPV